MMQEKVGLKRTEFILSGYKFINHITNTLEKGHVVAFEALKEVPMEVTTEPVRIHDDYWNITCKLMTDDDDDYLPKDFVESCNRVIVIGKLYTEGDVEYGTGTMLKRK